MDFAKGAIMGIIAGTVVGVMNSSSIMEMFQQGKKQLKKMKKLIQIKELVLMRQHYGLPG